MADVHWVVHDRSHPWGDLDYRRNRGSAPWTNGQSSLDGLSTDHAAAWRAQPSSTSFLESCGGARRGIVVLSGLASRTTNIARGRPTRTVTRVVAGATSSPVQHMSQTARRHRISDVERFRAVTAARERFLAGDDRVRGVRPEVATSWYRCREQYRVDPGLSQAPPASRAGRGFLRAHARTRDRVRPARWRRGVDRERGRERRRRRRGHRRHGSDPDRPGRPEDAVTRARRQHGAVVVLVGVGDGHERDGHGARGAGTGADQRARALVRGLSGVGLRRRGRARRRDARARSGP